VSIAVTLAGPDDIDRLEAMVAACHALQAVKTDRAWRLAALGPLLKGLPHGAAYLIGPPKAPIGYVVISFGWSLELGGLDACVDELFVREGVRGRGIGTEVLQRLVPSLAEGGVRALHLEVAQDNDRARAFYRRLGFQARSGYHLMTRRL